MMVKWILMANKFLVAKYLLTHYASISQEKFPIRFLNFSKFCTFLVSKMLKEVIPMSVDLRVPPKLFQSLL